MEFNLRVGLRCKSECNCHTNLALPKINSAMAQLLPGNNVLVRNSRAPRCRFNVIGTFNSYFLNKSSNIYIWSI